jgi:hypothetical protein
LGQLRGEHCEFARREVDENHVGRTTDTAGESVEMSERICELRGACVVLRQAGYVLGQRIDPRRGDHTRLSHATTERG